MGRAPVSNVYFWSLNLQRHRAKAVILREDPEPWVMAEKVGQDEVPYTVGWGCVREFLRVGSFT